MDRGEPSQKASRAIMPDLLVQSINCESAHIPGKYHYLVMIETADLGLGFLMRGLVTIVVNPTYLLSVSD